MLSLDEFNDSIDVTIICVNVIFVLVCEDSHFNFYIMLYTFMQVLSVV